jgi:hypothetical protein
MKPVLQKCPCCGKQPTMKITKEVTRVYKDFYFTDLYDNASQVICITENCKFNSFYTPKNFVGQSLATGYWNQSVIKYKNEN